uniref:Uncharacterized protein n=1 Tax=Rhabditophanes sp. KR3021 TaxID=114890 RepID=A0AC35TTH0_9BILA
MNKFFSNVRNDFMDIFKFKKRENKKQIVRATSVPEENRVKKPSESHSELNQISVTRSLYDPNNNIGAGGRKRVQSTIGTTAKLVNRVNHSKNNVDSAKNSNSNIKSESSSQTEVRGRSVSVPESLSPIHTITIERRKNGKTIPNTVNKTYTKKLVRTASMGRGKLLRIQSVDANVTKESKKSQPFFPL